MSSQGGAAAVLALVLVLAGIAVAGVILDIALVAIQRTRLDYAAEAAARGAVLACRGGGGECLAGAARRYLSANMPNARLDHVTADPPGRVTVRASAAAPRGLGVLWAAPPERLAAEFTLAAGAEAQR